MSNFISGGAVDCGPSTALKDVSSLVERDYGVQRDRYVGQPGAGSSAGPSAFRNRPNHAPQHAGPSANPFDVSQLRTHLPPAGPVAVRALAAGPMHARPVSQSPVSAPAASQNWADSFPATTAAKGKARAEPAAAWGNEFAQMPAPDRTTGPRLAPWQRGAGGFAPTLAHPMPMPMYASPPPVMHPHPVHPVTPQFAPPPPIPVQAEPQVKQQPQPQQQQSEPQQAQQNRPQDELARTAQALVDQLGQEHGTNDKLNNSQFVQLLRGLGEGSVVVQEGSGAVEEGQEVGEGAKFVAANGGGDWASAFLDNNTTSSEQASTTRLGQDAWAEQLQPALTMSESSLRNKSVHFDSAPMQGSMMPRDLNEALQHQTAKPGATQQWEESLDDDLDDFDTEALRRFNGYGQTQEPAQAESNSLHQDWLDMQDWSEEYGQAYEEPYLFHSANPYALGSPIVRELSPTTMGVLELEAAVQQDPRDADAWLALGLKQQENEREDAAIRALAKATQLAPETRAAYLALAVSYTNEGRDDSAHAALEKWIELGSPDDILSQTPGETREQRQARIVERLIQIACQNPEDLDADVQVALGVLFNASEDYAKAEDCFLAALEARPNDWVLYNRLGATLANSGRSHEAIKYYHRALALHPNFVRAQFNLGISYINLAQYRLAAQCILDAIRLQHSDVTEGYGADSAGQYTKGVTPDALWTTLRMACLHLQRPDLVTLANHHDLSGFPFEI